MRAKGIRVMPACRTNSVNPHTGKPCMSLMPPDNSKNSNLQKDIVAYYEDIVIERCFIQHIQSTKKMNVFFARLQIILCTCSLHLNA